MPHYRKLVGERCYLSPPTAEDAPLWAEWLNDLAVTLPLGDEAYLPLPYEKLEAEIHEAMKGGWHVFTIVDSATDAAIGRCLMFNIDQVNRSAMIGIFIGEKAYWGKGYGEDALRLLLDYAFSLLNLNNIMLGVFAYNERAIRLYQKLGFREIGRRRQARIVAGKAYDVILMDILAEEFPSSLVKNLIA